MFFGRKSLNSFVICFIFIFINTILIVFAQKKRLLNVVLWFSPCCILWSSKLWSPFKKAKKKKKLKKKIEVNSSYYALKLCLSHPSR